MSTASTFHQIEHHGDQGKLLLSDKESLFWSDISKHTNFGLANFREPIQNARCGGKRVPAPFQGSVHLIIGAAILTRWPGIMGVGVGSAAMGGTEKQDGSAKDRFVCNFTDGTNKYLVEPSWVRGCGHRLFERVDFRVSSSETIDPIYADFQLVRNQILCAPGRKMTEMIGDFGSDEAQQKRSRQPFVTLTTMPLWFDNSPSTPFAFVAAHGVSPELQITFEQLGRLLHIPSEHDAMPDVLVDDNLNTVEFDTATVASLGLPPSVTADYATPEDAIHDFTWKTTSVVIRNVDESWKSALTNPAVQNDSIECELEYQGVLLSEEELKWFLKADVLHLARLHQYIDSIDAIRSPELDTPAGGGVVATAAAHISAKIEIDLSYPVSAIYLILRKQSNLDTVRPYDLSAGRDPIHEGLVDPLHEVEIRANVEQRLSKREGSWLRLGSTYYSQAPQLPQVTTLDDVSRFIYVWNYCTELTSEVPTGFANALKIFKHTFNVTVNKLAFHSPMESAGSVVVQPGNTVVQPIIMAEHWAPIVTTGGALKRVY